MRDLVLICHNLRSSHNVGSLLRTADGLGVRTVYLTGYTPYPANNVDTRLPHIAQKIHHQIHKTALGAENTQAWEFREDVVSLINQLRAGGFTVCALEQVRGAIKLPDYSPPDKIAIVLGREVEGIEPEIIRLCDVSMEIPMFGSKESFNVVQAAAMALYHSRFAS